MSMVRTHSKTSTHGGKGGTRSVGGVGGGATGGGDGRASAAATEVPVRTARTAAGVVMAAEVTGSAGGGESVVGAAVVGWDLQRLRCTLQSPFIPYLHCDSQL